MANIRKKIVRIVFILMYFLVGFSFSSVYSRSFVNVNICVNQVKYVEREKVSTSNINSKILALKKILDEKKIDATTRKIPYTFAHQFYIPLLYAFDSNDIVLKNAFEAFFTADLVNMIIDSNELGSLDKKVFYFIVSEYLRKEGSLKDKNNKLIFNRVKSETLNYWNKENAKVWDGESYEYAGVKERLHSILESTVDEKKNYYSAVTDNELFVLATGTSLALLERNSHGKVDKDFEIMAEYFMNILKKLVVFEEKGIWYLQPNVWKDHIDYKYIVLNDNESVTWDAGHFSRFPSFLLLLRSFYNDDIDKQKYIEKLRSGLAKSFVYKVVDNYNIKNNVFHFNNYMNGNDSPYRIGYKTRSKGFNSGENYMHVFYGWWKLLECKKVDIIYENLFTNFNYYADQNELVKSHYMIYKEIIQLNFNENENITYMQ